VGAWTLADGQEVLILALPYEAYAARELAFRGVQAPGGRGQPPSPSTFFAIR